MTFTVIHMYIHLNTEGVLLLWCSFTRNKTGLEMWYLTLKPQHVGNTNLTFLILMYAGEMSLCGEAFGLCPHPNKTGEI